MKMSHDKGVNKWCVIFRIRRIMTYLLEEIYRTILLEIASPLVKTLHRDKNYRRCLIVLRIFVHSLCDLFQLICWITKVTDGKECK